jgi:hypothetical protein
MFKDDNGHPQPKLSDFGFSTQETERNIKLPVTRGWNAPEVNNTYPDFTFTDAVKADVFSLGLILLWLAAEIGESTVVLGEAVHVEANTENENVIGSDKDLEWLALIEQVHVDGADALAVREIVRSIEVHTSEAVAQKIDAALQAALSPDRYCRADSCSRVLQILDHSW